MSKVKLIFQIVVVVGSMLIAGILLYFNNDTRLETVQFVTDSAEIQITDVSKTDVSAVEEMLTNTAADITIPDGMDADLNDTVNEVDTTTVSTDSRSDIRTEYTVTVRIVGTQPSITCTVPAATASTVHHVMQQASTQCSFIYRGKNFSGLGFFVEQIGDLASDTAKGMYWIYAVNGMKAVLGVSEQMVQPGDTISWNYEAAY